MTRHVGSESDLTYRAYTARDRRLRVKARIAAILGAECLRCGYDDPRALCYDHVADDGHLDIFKGASRWSWILRNVAEALQRIQVLCANCNLVKEIERRKSLLLYG